MYTAKKKKIFQPCRTHTWRHAHTRRQGSRPQFSTSGTRKTRCTQGETASQLASCCICVPPRAKTCPQCKPFMFLSTNGSVRTSGEAANWFPTFGALMEPDRVVRRQRWGPASSSDESKVWWDCCAVLHDRGVHCFLLSGHPWHYRCSLLCAFDHRVFCSQGCYLDQIRDIEKTCNLIW